MVEVHPGSAAFIPTRPNAPRHVWVALHAPTPEGKIAIVNLTTQRENTDDTVVLDSEDHPYIDHPTAVRYRDATITDAIQFIRAADRYGEPERFRQPVLERMQNGIFQSKRTPNKVVEFCDGLI